MNPLTDQQRSILDVIRTSMETRRVPPTVTEIGRAIGLASDALVIRQLRMIQFKGYLQPAPGTRAVRILDDEVTPSA